MAILRSIAKGHAFSVERIVLFTFELGALLCC
jgi:hypothetical protein